MGAFTRYNEMDIQNYGKTDAALRATIWVNAINTDKNLRQLKSVQRVSHLMTTGAIPSTSLLALDKITDTTPIDIKVREEAVSGALSIMANGEWIDPLTAHNQGRLKSHIRIN